MAVVSDAGGRVVPPEDAEVLVWLDRRPATLPVLTPNVRWVQLGGAGAEQWLDVVAQHPDTTFTTARGAYSIPIAEHALALLLAGVRGIATAARANCWTPITVGTLEGSTVAIIGAGGIGRALIQMLAPLGASVIAVTRSGTPVEGATRTLGAAEMDVALRLADHVVVAAPSTAATRHLVDEEALATMKPHSWLVNVARGSLVDTDALVRALRNNALAGAALDVTEPEPLPADHPLWSDPRALITPHTGPAEAALTRHLAIRMRENLDLFVQGERLISRVDLTAGY
jgi:D-3-phosphoglycerate dehydrogenase